MRLLTIQQPDQLTSLHRWLHLGPPPFYIHLPNDSRWYPRSSTEKLDVQYIVSVTFLVVLVESPVTFFTISPLTSLFVLILWLRMVNFFVIMSYTFHRGSSKCVYYMLKLMKDIVEEGIDVLVNDNVCVVFYSHYMLIL